MTYEYFPPKLKKSSAAQFSKHGLVSS